MILLALEDVTERHPRHVERADLSAARPVAVPDGWW
jgi:hypothetical protein